MSRKPKEKKGPWAVLKVLPSDYTDYGGSVERWKEPGLSYPDCSCGCRWWWPMYDKVHGYSDADWGVCLSPESPRAGLLTWEHQAGHRCFRTRSDKEKP